MSARVCLIHQKRPHFCRARSRPLICNARRHITHHSSSRTPRPPWRQKRARNATSSPGNLQQAAAVALAKKASGPISQKEAQCIAASRNRRRGAPSRAASPRAPSHTPLRHRRGSITHARRCILEGKTVVFVGDSNTRFHWFSFNDFVRTGNEGDCYAKNGCGKSRRRPSEDMSIAGTSGLVLVLKATRTT